MHNLDEFLKSYGLKATKHRIEILSVLCNSKVALSHSDITDKLGDTYIDKVTLYRTLNIFTEKNILHKVASDDRNWKYAFHMEDDHESKTENEHAHFVCDECDHIYCVPMEPAFKLNVTKNLGFLVNSRDIKLHGICPTCQI